MVRIGSSPRPRDVYFELHAITDTLNAAGTTQYCCPSGYSPLTTTEHDVEFMVWRPFRVIGMLTHLQVVPGAGKTRTFTARLDGGDTVAVCTHGAADMIVTWEGSVPFAYLEHFTVKLENTAGSAGSDLHLVFVCMYEGAP